MCSLVSLKTDLHKKAQRKIWMVLDADVLKGFLCICSFIGIYAEKQLHRQSFLHLCVLGEEQSPQHPHSLQVFMWWLDLFLSWFIFSPIPRVWVCCRSCKFSEIQLYWVHEILKISHFLGVLGGNLENLRLRASQCLVIGHFHTCSYLQLPPKFDPCMWIMELLNGCILNCFFPSRECSLLCCWRK